MIARLETMGDPAVLASLGRFGSEPARALGIRIPELRKLARELGRDHALALDLWKSGSHEARILASMIDEPSVVTREQMDAWTDAFDTWDVCDQCCMNLFVKTPHAAERAVAWSGSEREFVKRAGFALMATLAVHDKKAPDEKFLAFMPLIERGASDDRNFVRKAVSWALRQIGKRNARLHAAAVDVAARLAAGSEPAPRRVGKDALRDLEGRFSVSTRTPRER